jgi:hypothetical protein
MRRGTLRAALDHAKLGVHFALVHDGGNAAPKQAFEHIGHSVVIAGKGVRTTASLDIAAVRAERSLRLFTPDSAGAAPRSSNRTCGFPASGSPTGFIQDPRRFGAQRVGGGALRRVH